MKILAFSDCHGDLPEIDKCDYVLIAGDICPAINHSIAYQTHWIEKVFIKWVNEIDCKNVILIPGNHDFIFTYRTCFKDETNNKLVILINESYNLIKDDNVIKIYGTPYCKKFGNWAFMKNNDELEEIYKSIPENLDILITHDAPNLNNQGMITEGRFAFTNAGNTPLGKEVQIKKPKLVLNGHIHSSPKYNSYDNIIMRNVSIKDEYYQIKYPVTELIY